LTTKSTVKEFCVLQTDLAMKANLSTERRPALAFIVIRTAVNTKDTLLGANDAGRVVSNVPVAICMKDHLQMIYLKAKEHIRTPMVVVTRVNGTKAESLELDDLAARQVASTKGVGRTI
jgi:hypothetical protein